MAFLNSASAPNYGNLSIASTGMASDAFFTASPEDVPASNAMSWFNMALLVLKTLIMALIIICAVFGNLLVIVSVMRHRKLRIMTNYFLVSLALADILVALVAMGFNASVVILGKWIFSYRMCDVWNSFDVYFCTASILHLCCISVDRYYAISRPLMYPLKITGKVVAIMLTNVWIWPAAISFLPIFMGWYTTKEHLEFRARHPDRCDFVVNKVYAIISSSVSFWIPCTIMVFTYYRIYQMASHQEKMLMRTADAAYILRQQNQRQSEEMEHHQSHHIQQIRRPQPDILITAATAAGTDSMTTLNASKAIESPTQASVMATNGSEMQKVNLMVNVPGAKSPHRLSVSGAAESTLLVEKEDPDWHSTPTKDRHLMKLKREHKAARTLGIIMGAFVLCWCPFFTWYLTIPLCGDSCENPAIVVEVMFWIGYFNSTLNPLIYAYFHRDFREAFKKTLICVFCWCVRKQPDAAYAHILRTSLAHASDTRIRHTSGDTISGIERIDSKRPSTCAVHKL